MAYTWSIVRLYSEIKMIVSTAAVYTFGFANVFGVEIFPYVCITRAEQIC